MADKIGDAHVVRTGPPDLLDVDLHLVHEVTSPQAFAAHSAIGGRTRSSATPDSGDVA